MGGIPWRLSWDSPQFDPFSHLIISNCNLRGKDCLASSVMASQEFSCNTNSSSFSFVRGSHEPSSTKDLESLNIHGWCCLEHLKPKILRWNSPCDGWAAHGKLENQSCTERSDCDIGSAPSICPKPEAFARWEPVKRRLSSCSGGISISSTSWQVLARGIFFKFEEFHHETIDNWYCGY